MENYEHLDDSCRIVSHGKKKPVENASDGFGEVVIKKVDFSGIRLLYGRLKFIKPVPVQVMNDSPYVEMFFLLSGCRDSHFSQSNVRDSIDAGYHNLYYIPDSEFYIEPTAEVNESIYIQIQFTKEYFKRFLPESHPLLYAFIKNMNEDKLSVLSSVHLRITAEMYTLLNEILHCEKEGVMRQLYTETNMLKLLSLQIEQCGSAVKKEGNHVKQHDVEKFEMVKKLLEKNIAYSHSLAELSRLSGLNDFKLKKGFKALYGTTVFGYLHELRMVKAAQLLAEEAMPIAEIAECCGYVYGQSFSTAFKQRYGTTPEKFRKKERPPHSGSLFL
ncbi:helix-turn-helix domain-containing protein [Flavobacterium hauense]